MTSKSTAQLEFAKAAASLTNLYKLAHASQVGHGAANDARDEVRRFADLVAVENPSPTDAPRRYVALDDLLAFLDQMDSTDRVPHTFGNKRVLRATRNVPNETALEPQLRRHRTGSDDTQAT